ncbi:hypothetical protein STEG23_014400 [Scotinomys teguina]
MSALMSLAPVCSPVDFNPPNTFPKGHEARELLFSVFSVGCRGSYTPDSSDYSQGFSTRISVGQESPSCYISNFISDFINLDALSLPFEKVPWGAEKKQKDGPCFIHSVNLCLFIVGKIFFNDFVEYVFCAFELVFFSFFYPYYSRCPSTEEWIRKMWFIYTMEYYAAEKNNDFMKFAGKWKELENVILSQVHNAPLFQWEQDFLFLID